MVCDHAPDGGPQPRNWDLRIQWRRHYCINGIHYNQPDEPRAAATHDDQLDPQFRFRRWQDFCRSDLSEYWHHLHVFEDVAVRVGRQQSAALDSTTTARRAVVTSFAALCLQRFMLVDTFEGYVQQTPVRTDRPAVDLTSICSTVLRRAQPETLCVCGLLFTNL
jgi:hypothetical protein